jgi:hypothetical protein
MPRLADRFTDMLADDEPTVLQCTPVSATMVETERCVLCQRKHYHGVAGIAEGGSHAHRTAHCVNPPKRLPKHLIGEWHARVRKGYYLRLA